MSLARGFIIRARLTSGSTKCGKIVSHTCFMFC